MADGRRIENRFFAISRPVLAD